MGKVSKKVLEKIEEKNIKPIPKWHFILKDSFVWSLFVLNIILGSIGFAIIIYLFVSNDSLFDFSLTKNIWQGILLSVPLLWILLTILFLFVAYYNFRNTQEGYRFTVLKKVLLNIVITFILGLILFTSGFSERLNRIFVDNISFYTHTFDRREEIWMRPQEGYLSGEILDIDSNAKESKLLDLYGKQWSVVYTKANIKPRVVFEVGQRIKIIGKMSSDNTFVASEIRPWIGMGRGMQEN